MNQSRKIASTACFIAGMLMAVLASISLIKDPMLPAAFYVMAIVLGSLFIYSGWRIHSGTGRLSRWAQAAAVLLMVYIAGECTMNSLVWTKKIPDSIPALDFGFGVFNKPCASYDPVRGFRWDQGEWRMSKIINRTVVYDQRFRPNRQGIYASADYTYDKKDSASLRYITFGDSFTAGEFLQKTWPERVNELAQKHGQQIELYSFALNGGGLFNWHSTFFNEIVANYEFDGVIMAVFANDLDRDFFVMEHTEETGFTGYLDSRPEDAADLLNNYRDRLDQYAKYMPDSLIDSAKRDAIAQMEARYNLRPRLYFLPYLASLYTLSRDQAAFRKFLDHQLSPSDEPYDIDQVRDALGEKKLQRAGEIAAWCSQHDKRLILASLPYEPVLPHMANGRDLNMIKHIKAIAGHYEADFFDGMGVFTALDKPSQKASFLPFDVHWSQAGSDRFAKAFYTYLTSENP